MSMEGSRRTSTEQTLQGWLSLCFNLPFDGLELSLHLLINSSSPLFAMFDPPYLIHVKTIK